MLKTFTPEEKERRRKFIGGSDAPVIMKGTHFSKTVKKLWMEKLGKAEEEDLSNKLAVQMGIYTEAFNRKWFTRKTGIKVSRNNCSFLVSRDHEFIGGNLDGRVTTDDGPGVWEAKHTSSFGKGDIIDTYYAQLQHLMYVTDTGYSIISVLQDNNKFFWELVERNQLYIDDLVEKEIEFWSHVTDGTQP